MGFDLESAIIQAMGNDYSEVLEYFQSYNDPSDEMGSGEVMSEIGRY